MAEPTNEQLMTVYFKIKDTLDAEAAALKAKQNDMATQLDLVKTTLHNRLKASGDTQLKNAAGLAFIQHNDFVSVDDWETFLGFICAHLAKDVFDKIVPGSIPNAQTVVWREIREALLSSDSWAFFNKVVNKTQVMDYIKASQEKQPPEGLRYSQEQVLMLRRPTNAKKA